MTPREAAYAALGLRPGVAPALVDEAYRRLIKAHHPDKTGGDAARAAEINRAYSLLRRERLALGPHTHRVPVTTAPPRRRRSARGDWIFTGVLLAIVIGGWALLQAEGSGSLARPIALRFPASPVDGGTAPLALQSFDEPLHAPVINAAIADAVKFHSARDSTAAQIYSRDCQLKLRQQRTLVWFDACTAFDEATLTLSFDGSIENGEELADSTVAAREMAAARVLSDDLVGADSRLHQIRSQVELQLLPLMDSAAAQNL